MGGAFLDELLKEERKSKRIVSQVIDWSYRPQMDVGVQDFLDGYVRLAVENALDGAMDSFNGFLLDADRFHSESSDR